MPNSKIGGPRSLSVGIPEPMAPARGRSGLKADSQTPWTPRGIPEPIAPARVRPGAGLDPATVNPALENLSSPLPTNAG